MNVFSLTPILIALSCFISTAGFAGTNATFDVEIAPGTNYEMAAFRWWHPSGAKALRGVLVLVPGSNDDGRSQVEDSFWQVFARQHNLALVGCYFTDHHHENMSIEEYAQAGAGSGPALLEAINRLAKVSGHDEATNAPLLLWGHSAGGEFNYEFACWKPERLTAFVVNKGGFYFTHLAPAATRALPGIFFIGGKDETFRIQSIQGIFAINQRAGCAWKLTVEPDEAHEQGKTREQGVAFFEEVLARHH
jgi:poly(3-hydroxybutyrate) depolymerase